MLIEGREWRVGVRIRIKNKARENLAQNSNKG
jgi:hypothetical protein